MAKSTRVAEGRRRAAGWQDRQNLEQIPHLIGAGKAFDVRADLCACGRIERLPKPSGALDKAHAGWKGAFTGVLENTVATMESLGARRENIVAVLGPSISAKNYEVGPEFVDRFVGADPANIAYFEPSSRSGHAMFDLNRYTVDRLSAAGVTAEALYRCTYAEEDLFYSYRRATHRSEPDYGRHVSAIVLEHI